MLHNTDKAWGTPKLFLKDDLYFIFTTGLHAYNIASLQCHILFLVNPGVKYRKIFPKRRNRQDNVIDDSDINIIRQCTE